jgi:hypothetical protein
MDLTRRLDLDQRDGVCKLRSRALAVGEGGLYLPPCFPKQAQLRRGREEIVRLSRRGEQTRAGFGL